MFSALLHVGHVSGVDETICCHFTAFRKFCCCMCFENRHLPELKTWWQMDIAVGALRSIFQYCWCHYGKLKILSCLLSPKDVCGPSDPPGRTNASHPPPSSTADTAARKEAGEVHEVPCWDGFAQEINPGFLHLCAGLCKHQALRAP